MVSRTEEVCNIEAGRARLVDGLEVRLAFAVLARVDHLAKGQDDELVEHGDDVAARLMDREDDSAVVVAREGDQTVNDVEGIERIKT